MVGDQTLGFMQTRESLYQLSYNARPSTNLCVDNGCVGLFTHVHMCMQRPEVNSRYLLPLPSTLFFFQTVSHWTQNCLIKLAGWPVSFKVHVSLPFQDGVTDIELYLPSPKCKKPKLRSSCFLKADTLYQLSHLINPSSNVYKSIYPK